MSETPVADDALARGTPVGRFVVIERVASGGMGSLYRAFDPELDRVVALKLLRSGGEPRSRGASSAERLLREAKVLARLAHPNIVTVFEAGSFGDHVFIAMEFVEGVTLREWLRAPRAVDAILDVFLGAGEGLAAAHAAGLVHRDFKPDNVIVGDDGRARVVDFGLARAAHTPDPNARWSQSPGAPLAPSEPEAPAAEPSVSPDGAMPFDAPLTRVGVLLGTPLYMSPEQLLGLGVDARSDQFSFVVSLFEALYGALPFPAKTEAELRDKVSQGVVTFPGTPSRAARWLRAVVMRGLRPVPADRFASVADLLLAIRRGRRRTRRGAIAFAGALILGLAAIATYATFARARAPVCADAQGDLRGIWDDAQRAAVRRAVLGTHLPFGEDVLRRAEHAIDAYVARWVALERDACEATQVRRTQSAELMDLRMECLAHALVDLHARVDVLATADAKVVERAAALLPATGDLDVCADASALRAPARLPADPALHARLDSVRKDLAHVRALTSAGRFAEALPAARASAAEATSIGHRPTEAEALFTLGETLEASGDYKASERALQQAARAGEAGFRDDVVARARIALIGVVGDKEGRYPDARERAEDAEAMVERLSNDEYRGDLDQSVSRLAVREGKLEEAASRAQNALLLREKRLGEDDPLVADVIVSLGDIASQQGKEDLAASYYERAIHTLERALGPGHPRVARVVMNLGGVRRRTARYDESAALYEQARAILERAYGPEHDVVATVLVNLGSIARARRDLPAALGYYRRAAAIWEKALGPEHPNVGTAQLYIGKVLARQGHPDEALVAYGRARAIWEKALGADNATVAAALAAIGSAQLDEHKLDEAIATQTRAVTMMEKAMGADYRELAEPLTGLGLALLAGGQPAKATVPLERAVRLREASASDPIDTADARFALARALSDGTGDPTRARTLALAARAAYERPGEATRSDLHAVDAWLAAHGGAP